MRAVKNGVLVLKDRIVKDHYLILDNDTIAGIEDHIHESDFDKITDAHGRYVLPGFIDIHSDKIEQFIQPRPTTVMDFELALKECEKELLAEGVTTMYHSLSLYADELFGSSAVRSRENVEKLADLIASLHEREHLIHHRLHLRIEIDNLDAYQITKEMIKEHKVQEISFMDHTPGQGQYHDLELYRKTIEGFGGSDVKKYGFEGVMEHQKNKKMLSFEQMKELTDLAHANHIPVASHDDDSVEKLETNKALGVDISEFPLTVAVAEKARQMGFATIAGAPNILLGGSHSGNMSAEEAILAGCVDILCSDYYPAALLHSVFWMHRKHGIPLWDMVNMVSLNPAKAVRIDSEYGSIEPGKKADLLIVDCLNHYPVITHAFVDGAPALRMEYRI